MAYDCRNHVSKSLGQCVYWEKFKNDDLNSRYKTDGVAKGGYREKKKYKQKQRGFYQEYRHFYENFDQKTTKSGG